MHSIQITEEGVTKLLNKFNPHKTPGPDNITPGVLKELATHISVASSANNLVLDLIFSGMSLV
jgi:hypothetical protein